jgi:hypothetical protein
MLIISATLYIGLPHLAHNPVFLVLAKPKNIGGGGWVSWTSAWYKSRFWQDLSGARMKVSYTGIFFSKNINPKNEQIEENFFPPNRNFLIQVNLLFFYCSNNRVVLPASTSRSSHSSSRTSTASVPSTSNKQQRYPTVTSILILQTHQTKEAPYPSIGVWCLYQLLREVWHRLVQPQGTRATEIQTSLLWLQVVSGSHLVGNLADDLMSIFLVLSHMFGYLAQKLLGRLWKSLVFLKSKLYIGENIKFHCDPFSNKKGVLQRSSCRQWGLSEMAYFIFGDFSTKLGTSVDLHEKIIIWKFHWNRPWNKWQRANIVRNLY